MGPGRALRMAYVVASVAGVAFFAISVALLGYWPARVLQQQTRAMSPEHPLGLGASEERGRAIYSREGCAYCHSQQVRYVRAVMERFGAPTLAWEPWLDYPHLWGTRRIGPDLSREGGTRSDDWHFAHLYSPRAIVSTSVMPAYPSLFDGAADQPRQEARDLVAYLGSLGRAREIAGPEGEAHARKACECPDDEMAQMAFHVPLNPHPGKTRRATDAPVLPDIDRNPGDVGRNFRSGNNTGLKLYADHCASCHGATGVADGPGALMLDPRPSNLAEHEYTPDRVAEILWNGVDGTAMSAWRDRSLADLAALTVVVRSLHSPQKDPAVPGNIGELGARAYAANCVQCHGDSGAGDGPAAAKLRIAPPDFRRQRPSLAEAQRTLRDGVHGTPMAPWTDRLGAAEILAVAMHVRSFYTGETSR